MCKEQMVRGGKITGKKNSKKRFWPNDKGSDDSDEDYVASDYENGASDCSDENFCSSLDGFASGEDNFINEEEEEGEEPQRKVRRTVEPKARNGLGSNKGRRKIGRKRRRFSCEEGEDGDEEEHYTVDDDNDYEEEEEEEEEEEDEVDEEVEDEDFMLEEEDFSDEEEPFVRTKGNNVKPGRKGVRKKTSRKVCKKKKPKSAKKPSRNRGRKNHGWRVVRSSDDEDFSDNCCTVTNTRRKNPVPKRRRCVAQSDLDILVSKSSDYEYTISEEEREQVREAQKLCGTLRTRNRRVTSPRKVEALDLCVPRKPPVGKGKEKVEEVKTEVVKQVCGICLSEEDKRRVRGKLNCCSHFFCFSCINEWAKVESRCPLCKQRFQTISRPAKSGGIDLREVVIQIPERDQVYQPSEEELRSFLDPYENVICIECHQGGDDNLMLLCDICDSPAHTYCVGHERRVPDGNWYCFGCNTNGLGSSSSEPPVRLSDRRTVNNLFHRPQPAVNREGLDLNSLSSPLTPSIWTPRFSAAEVQSTSPMSQATTLLARRNLRLHIINNRIRSSNQMGLGNYRTDGASAAANLGGGALNSQVVQGRETAFEHTREQEMGISSQPLFGESLNDNPFPTMQREDLIDSESSHFSRQMHDSHVSVSRERTGDEAILNPLRRSSVENPMTMAVDRNLNGTLWPELVGVNSLSNREQIHHYSNLFNSLSVNGLTPPSVRDEKDYCAAKEQLQPIIESYLKNMSRDMDLGEIATKAASTILAECGFEHLIDEAYRVSPPSQCSHIELSMGGGGRRSLMEGLCSACFEAYVGDVVEKIRDSSVSLTLTL